MELLEALKVIKEECEKHLKCSECPLRTKSSCEHLCGIKENNPDRWKLKNEDIRIPRVFE